ncbi:MAG: transglycosylase domain-containing protein [Oscillospiraceae bacterium]
MKENSTDKQINNSFPKKKKNKKTLTPFQKTMRVIGTVVLSLILVVIITGSIVVTALTIYVMSFMDTTNDISLEDLQLGFTTFIYGKDTEGDYVEIATLTTGDKRIWVDIEDIPEDVKNAFVYSEDERFYTHDGVDFKRTFAAFANLLLHFWDSEQGASTITQQLIKIVSGDDAVAGQEGIERKVREIFRAINLERSYTKEDILEVYLNVIYLNNNCHGIEAAANFYFNKSISELTLAEAASIASLNKDPTKYDPIKHPETNKARQEYILFQIYDNGIISTDEYEAALAEKLNFVGYNKPDDGTSYNSAVTSYFVDTAIEEAKLVLMDLYGIDKDEAELRLKSGGYKIYTTVDLEMQAELEAKYSDMSTFTSNTEPEKHPQSAAIIMNYQGNVLAVVGGIGKKTESRILNRATDSPRSPGSCIKPIASYGPAIMLDLINWSSKFKDEPLKQIENSQGVMVDWPKNYSMTYSYKYNFAFQCLQQSLNTTAAQIIDKLTPQTSFDYLTTKLNFSTLIDKKAITYEDGSTRVYSDIDYSPMAVGALTEGVTLKELVASYQIFGNLGQYYEPTFISMITNSEGDVVYQHKYIAQQPMDDASAYVMNRMMKNVVESYPGTGVKAKVGVNVELIGKTGTSQDWNDLLFVGCTPDYISGVWYGYDIPEAMNPNPYYSSAQIWNNVFKDIVNQGENLTFAASPNVKELYFCAETGLIANDTCEKYPTPGYYKLSNIPPMCTLDHTYQTNEDDDSSEESED